MNLEKQKLILSYFVESISLYTLMLPLIKSKYFDPELQHSVEFMEEYYHKYNLVPNSQQIKAETGVEINGIQMREGDYEYVVESAENFCKQRAIECAVMESIPLMEEGKSDAMVELIKEAAGISLYRDLGVNYFENVQQRIQDSFKSQSFIPSGIDSIDDVIEGFIRGGIHVFSANSGGGKSLMLGNFGWNIALLGLNVIYITLELSEEMINIRLDSMISGVGTAERKYKVNDIVSKIENAEKKSGQYFVEYMNSGTTPNQIKNYVKEVCAANNFKVDCIIVDYLDIMHPNKGSFKVGDVFDKDKQTTEELRNVANELDCIVLTASQQNRGAIEAPKLNQSHVAGGLSKVNTSDLWISVNLNDEMKEEGLCGFHFLKTRYCDGVGKTVYCDYDVASMRISSGERKGPTDAAPDNKKPDPRVLLSKFDI